MGFIAEWVLAICTGILVVLTIFSIFHKHWEIVFASFIVEFGFALPIFSAYSKIKKHNVSDTTSSIDSTVSNNDTYTSHNTYFNYSSLLIILGAIVAFIVVMGLAYVVSEYAKGKKAVIAASNKRKLAEFERLAILDSRLTADWNSLLDNHAKILDEWNSYDKDIQKLLDLPAMRNFELPKIGAVIDALDAADDVKTLHYPEGTMSINDTPYYYAVKKCKKAFDEAIREAVNYKNKVMTERERNQLKIAKQLLCMAIDNSVSFNERQLAYSRVMSIMEDLRIEVPEKIISQIEHDTRKLLEA